MKKHLNKSMVEFVKDCRQNNKLDNIRRFWACEHYANALSQTPRLGHFIPCDENDVPLEKPNNYEAWLRKALNTPYDADLSKYEKYQQACDRVLFDGCKVLEYNKKVSYIQCRDEVFGIGFKKGIIQTIEDLIKHNLPLTEAGAKFFGL